MEAMMSILGEDDKVFGGDVKVFGGDVKVLGYEGAHRWCQGAQEDVKVYTLIIRLVITPQIVHAPLLSK